METAQGLKNEPMETAFPTSRGGGFAPCRSVSCVSGGFLRYARFDTSVVARGIWTLCRCWFGVGVDGNSGAWWVRGRVE